MAHPEKFPRTLIHKIEQEEELPLTSLEAIRLLREYLAAVEDDAYCRARDLGASITEIAEVVGMTRQGVYNKLKQLQAQRASERKGETLVVPELETEREQ